MQPTELPSGVIAMGARSHVPQLGRYLQPDPVPGGSADAYAYVFGDPVNSSDPSGADGMPAWAVAYNNHVAHQLTEAATARRIEAEQREAAEEAAARAAAAAAAQAAQAAAAAQFASTEAPWEQAYAMGGPSISETIAATGITEGGGMEGEGGGGRFANLEDCSGGCHTTPQQEQCLEKAGDNKSQAGKCFPGQKGNIEEAVGVVKEIVGIGKCIFEIVRPPFVANCGNI